jgi:prolipoprotein diacylglyceryltransferase
MNIDVHWAAPAHAVLEFAGIGIGAAMYRRARKHEGMGSVMAPGGFAILVGLLLGAGLGNKLVFLIERPDVFHGWFEGHWVMPGQSVVGGFLGGLLGVELAKLITRQPQSTGDLMVWPITVGLVIGRVGCFIAGLHDDTYGVATSLPWGVDFGDGVFRHPTQLYEIVFVLLWSGWLLRTRDRWAVVPGLMFKLFLSGYLLWRLAVDGIKPVLVPYAWGLSGIQWTCIIALAVYLPITLRALARVRQTRGSPCGEAA